MTTKRKLELEAEKEFIKLLDKAIDKAYEAGIENRGDIHALPIIELYRYLTTQK